MSLRRPCPCCGNLTLAGPEGCYEICEVCYWEDDPVQLADPVSEGGANGVSLTEARANYARIGACSEEFVRSVRPPSHRERGRYPRRVPPGE